MLQIILLLMQIFLAFCNICIMIFAFRTFLSKPHTTLAQEVAVLKHEVAEIKKSLEKGNKRFTEQDSTNEVLIRSTLALIEYEIQYCLTEHKPMTEDLKNAKEALHAYLSKK